MIIKHIGLRAVSAIYSPTALMRSLIVIGQTDKVLAHVSINGAAFGYKLIAPSSKKAGQLRGKWQEIQNSDQYFQIPFLFYW